MILFYDKYENKSFSMGSAGATSSTGLEGATSSTGLAGATMSTMCGFSAEWNDFPFHGTSCRVSGARLSDFRN